MTKEPHDPPDPATDDDKTPGGIDAGPDATAQQTRRAGQLRAALLATEHDDLAGIQRRRDDPDQDTTRAWVHQERHKGRLLVVPTEHGEIYPSFQFTPDGALRPEIAALIQPLQHAGLGPWQTWTWLVTPAALLSGEIPADIAATQPDRVARATTHLAARVEPAHALPTQVLETLRPLGYTPTTDTTSALGPDDGGSWVAVSGASYHLWDLDAGTYARIPGPHTHTAPMPYDNIPRPIHRVDQWPKVGGQSFVLFEDDHPDIVQTRRSSLIRVIRRLARLSNLGSTTEGD